MKMHSCFTCKFRDLPIGKNPCKKGVVDETGIVLMCMGHSDFCRKESKKVTNDTPTTDKSSQ